MNDMSPVIIPKSDQISADDLISGPMTVTIREVKISPGAEQPVNILVDQTDRAYRPCKSMSRVLVQAWGPDASKYVGRSLTLYRDPTVKWGGLEVGGIRISHLSHIDGVQQMVLTATKGSRKPFKVLPLVIQEPKPAQARQTPEEYVDSYIANVKACATIDDLMDLQTRSAKALLKLSTERPDFHELTTNAGTKRAAELQETAGVDV